MGGIQSFTDLKVWQVGHELVLSIYSVTKKFPKDETFGLISQIRRAVVSVTSNIAEGFRRETYKEKVRFYFISQASLSETQNQLLIARDVHYISQQEFFIIAGQTVQVGKLLSGLIKSSKNKI